MIDDDSVFVVPGGADPVVPDAAYHVVLLYAVQVILDATKNVVHKIMMT
jgi:hypothetical protein